MTRFGARWDRLEASGGDFCEPHQSLDRRPEGPDQTEPLWIGEDSKWSGPAFKRVPRQIAVVSPGARVSPVALQCKSLCGSVCLCGLGMRVNAGIMFWLSYSRLLKWAFEQRECVTSVAALSLADACFVSAFCECVLTIVPSWCAGRLARRGGCLCWRAGRRTTPAPWSRPQTGYCRWCHCEYRQIKSLHCGGDHYIKCNYNAPRQEFIMERGITSI